MVFKPAALLEKEIDSSNKSISGRIFDIQKFSHTDGYGIRTLILMKGCPLRCKWCANPESQNIMPEILFFEESCLHCNSCEEICENIRNNTGLCSGCGKCAQVCFPEARKLAGLTLDEYELFEIIKKDIAFYKESGGGITVGGGEPTMQSDFLYNFFKICKNNGINTAIETCGHSDWSKLEKLLTQTDLLLFDIKHIKSKKHEEFTGVKNALIIKNAIKASKIAKEMIVRIPLITDFNTSEEDLRLTGNFIKSHLKNVKKIEILPYHSIGESKSKRLNRKYELAGLRNLKDSEITECKKILENYVHDVTIVK